MEKLKEKSTWVGIVGIVVTAGGWALAPEYVEAIATAAAALSGAALVYLREHKAK